MQFSEPTEWTDEFDAHMQEELAKGQICGQCGAPAERILMLASEDAIVENDKVIRNEILTGCEWYCLACWEMKD